MKHLLPKIKELTQILCLPAVTGHMSLFAATGFLTIQNAPVIGLVFIAGPVALLLAATIGHTIFENILVTLISSLIATTVLVIAAIIGSSVSQSVDLRVLQITGGIVLISIALTMFGLRIPTLATIGIMLIGIAVSILKRSLFS